MKRRKFTSPIGRIMDRDYSRERIELMIQDDADTNRGLMFGRATCEFFAGKGDEYYRYGGRVTPYEGGGGDEVVVAVHPDPMDARRTVAVRYRYLPSVRFGGHRARCGFVFLGRD